MTRRWLKCLPALAALFSSTASFADPASDAQTIMKAMNLAYAGLKSYQDDGAVRQKKGGRSIQFSYQFARPNLLRFSWQGTDLLALIDGPSVVTSDGHETHTCRTPAIWFEQCAKEEGIVMAMAGATGVSRSTAVFRLLTQASEGFPINQLQGLTLVGKEAVEGSDCYRIVGNHPRGFGRYELWIGVSDLLIRKIETADDEEIHRHIAINPEITAERFRRKDS